VGLFSGSKPSKSEKCPHCRKPQLVCKCYANKVTPLKEKAKIKDSRGHTRTVTRNSNVGVDARGINWCGTCSCRVINGRCSNRTCSTNR
jgi:hypothetical protein